jgi:elongator complex protein 1
VAVIDGQIIKVTPLSAANIPPPMALHEIEVQSNILDVSINDDASLIAILHQQGISLLDRKNASASGSSPSLSARVTFGKACLADNTYQQVSFSENNELLVLRQAKTGSNVTRYGFDDNTGRMEEKTFTGSLPSAISTLSTFSQNGSSIPFVQGPAGDLHSLASDGPFLGHCKSPIQLPWIEVVSHGDDHIAFGMSGNGHLYANSRLLVKNCTSFLVTPAHLIFTTTMHLLKFVHITSFDGNFHLFQFF